MGASGGNSEGVMAIIGISHSAFPGRSGESAEMAGLTDCQTSNSAWKIHIFFPGHKTADIPVVQCGLQDLLLDLRHQTCSLWGQNYSMVADSCFFWSWCYLKGYQDILREQRRVKEWDWPQVQYIIIIWVSSSWGCFFFNVFQAYSSSNVANVLTTAVINELSHKTGYVFSLDVHGPLSTGIICG